MQEQQGYDTDEDDRGYTKPSIELASVASGGQSKSATRKPVSSSGEEARLVNQVCTPGGVRAQPSPEELRIFIESVGSLSGQEIADQLENKLVSHSLLEDRILIPNPLLLISISPSAPRQ